MSLIACPECANRVSDKALACPGCGHPIAAGSARSGGVTGMVGSVAGTYISATTLASLILGVVMFVCVAAVLITLIVSNR